jgi:lipopolysaccharide/colanic/teichoic acid biosynthesis glycosyltransferase
LDICGAALLLILLLPLMVLIAIGVKLTSSGPVLFRQKRPGRNGLEFVIVKFRTMVVSKHQSGPALTWTADPRVTKFGGFLRKWKLDEFPQLFNVLRGDMSFVGPRPLPPALWNGRDIQQRAACVLSVRPGITGRSALDFRSEEHLFVPLASLPAAEAEAVYVRHIMPLKLKVELEYLRSASLAGDCRIAFRTVFRVFNPHKGTNGSVTRQSLSSLAQSERTAAAGKAEPAATVSQGD